MALHPRLSSPAVSDESCEKRLGLGLAKGKFEDA
jgi:hypothetical protein